MNKDEIIELFDELEGCLHDIEEIYKLTKFMKKYCDSNKDSDELYEISSVVSITTEKLDMLSHNLYDLIHRNDIPPIFENIHKNKK